VDPLTKPSIGGDHENFGICGCGCGCELCQGVVAAVGSVHHPHARDVGLGRTRTSLPFHDGDHRQREMAASCRGAQPRHELACCARAIPPPPGGPGPDHVCHIDQEHTDKVCAERRPVNTATTMARPVGWCMIERRPFGRTGHQSSRIIFGSAGLGEVDQETADSLLPLLTEFGVNHLDTAASYGGAELRLAPWLHARRDDFFVATKTAERTADGARRSLEASLGRLGVDQVDMIQLHNLVEDDEWAVAHAPGGALEALVAARDEGLVRFIGVTGHGLRIPRMHLRSLERFPYDSVLFPYNFPLLCDPVYRADVEALLAVCEERAVAVQTIKSIARRRWSDPTSPEARASHSWYEPLRDADAVGRAVRYVLAQELLFLDSSSEFEVLRAVLQAADSAARAPAEDELRRDLAVLQMVPLFDGGALERI
jgi:aryl-alcohol dehydrogenase-like predicted oxidoreductase